MNTGELADLLSHHGTRVVNVITPEGNIQKGTRIIPVISARQILDCVIQVSEHGLPLTAQQTARELSTFDHDGRTSICFTRKNRAEAIDTCLYYDIKNVTLNEAAHAIMIHLGTFIC